MRFIGFLPLLAGLAACSTKGLWSRDAAGRAYDSDRAPSAVPAYKVEGDCDGFPRVRDVKTAPGLCLGLVDKNDGHRDLALRKPRAIAAYGDDLILTDMDGWGRREGRVFLLKKQPDGKYIRFLLLTASELPRSQRAWLYMPSSVQEGPDGLVYVGATSSILRFDPMSHLFDGLTDPNPARSRQKANRRLILEKLELVLDGLPFRAYEDPSEDSLHPLKPFVFDREGNMYIGVGASTDNCGKNHEVDERCAEAEGQGSTREGAHAKMLRADYDPVERRYKAPVAIAFGLRNAMAMAFHPLTGELFQGENSHDKRDEQHLSRLGPADELNIIREGEDYGWPYCVEFKNETPPYAGGGWDCERNYEAPHLLLPPHGAPLSMIFYTGDKLPEWYRNKLIMPLHSAEPFAHRIISFEADEQLRPTGRPLNLVWNWESAEPGRAFNGFPFGVAQASDGSIFVTEDKNQTVLRLSRDGAPGAQAGPPAAWEADDEWMGPRGL